MWVLFYSIKKFTFTQAWNSFITVIPTIVNIITFSRWGNTSFVVTSKLVFKTICKSLKNFKFEFFKSEINIIGLMTKVHTLFSLDYQSYFQSKPLTFQSLVGNSHSCILSGKHTLATPFQFYKKYHSYILIHRWDMGIFRL